MVANLWMLISWANAGKRRSDSVFFWSFAWGDMFYDEIPVDIIRMIVEMEGLIRMVAFEHGAKVVVSPF